MVLATALGLEALYALPFLWLITRLDRFQREPAKLALLAILWGGLVSTWLMASPANGAVLSLWGKLVGIDFAIDWGPALTAPFTEETAKLTGVVMMVLLARQHVRSTYDGMLLGMFVGLGFQVFENVQYLCNFVVGNFSSNTTKDMALIYVTRGVTGFWGHWMFTGICGAGVGYFVGAADKPLARRIAVAAIFILFSMLCHGLFDAGGGIGAWGIGLAVPLMTIGIIVAWKLSGRRASTWMRDLLDEDVASGVVTPEERDLLTGPKKQRRKHLKALKRASGKAAAKHLSDIFEAEKELARRIAATNDTRSAATESAREALRKLRESS